MNAKVIPVGIMVVVLMVLMVMFVNVLQVCIKKINVPAKMTAFLQVTPEFIVKST